MTRLRMALRLLLRDWRAGELSILIAAVVIAVGAVTAIGFFGDRLNRAMIGQSAELVGADLRLTGPTPAGTEWIGAALSRQLRHTRTLEFASVVVQGERVQLAGVIAVDAGYPLRGAVRTAPALYTEDAPAGTLPASGTAWVEARVLQALDIDVGARMEIGDAAFTITRVLTYEPGRSGGGFVFAPRVMIAYADVARTGVVQPGSRVTYSDLFTADGPDATGRLDDFKLWLNPRLRSHHRLFDVRDDNATIGRALERTERYLGLTGLLAVILAGVAIAMGAQRYSRRHFDVSAMLRCLGATQREILDLYLPQLLALAIFAGAIGCAVGWLAHLGIFQMLRELLPATVPPAGIRPAAFGMLTGVITLAGFGLPPVLRLRAVPPLRVLRRELMPLPPSAWLVYGMAAAAIAALMWWMTGDLTMTTAVLAGGMVVAAGLAGLALGLLTISRRLPQRVGVAWRFGLNNLVRRTRTSVGQILAFGLALMAMAVIMLLRNDLLESWRAQLPPDTPNHFAFNILPQDVAPMERFFHERDIRSTALYPMVRGRLVAINGATVTQAVTKEESDNEALQRELNLTWTDEVPSDNRIVDGQWWQPDTPPDRVSVEKRLADKLEIRLGDVLTFSIGGQTLTATVASLRQVQWESFHPNFYMIFPPGLLDAYPSTYITSFILSPEQKPLVTDLVRAFPAVTVLDMAQVLGQVRGVLVQVTAAIELVLLFAIAAGLAVMAAALAASLDERFHEGALLRTMGASRYQLRSAHLAEFGVLGLLAGLLAAFGTELIAYVLYTRVFDIEYAFKWQVWLAAPVAGCVLIGLAGFVGTRRVVRMRPAAVLGRL